MYVNNADSDKTPLNAAHHPENPKMNYIEMGKSTFRKIPKFSDPENFAVIYLKFKQRPNLRVFHHGCKRNSKQ